MKKAYINAHIFTGTTEIKNGFIMYDETIETVGEMNEMPAFDGEVIDAKGKYIIPGMIDVHLHGGYDIDTMDGEADSLVAFSNHLLTEGVTTFFPTTMTQAHDAIEEAIEACAIAEKKGANIGGIHVEGPFVSKKRAGAQPLEYIVQPNVDIFKQWNEKAEGLIKLVTFAPEEEGAKQLQAYFKEHNIVGTAGHTDAYYDDLVGAGVTHFTHLYNQMRGLHHREPGVVGYALLNEDAYVEVIPDGIHIHPEMVKLAYRLKGAERVCVITDAMRAKGLKPGTYELGGQPVIVDADSARLEDGTLAGSILTMIDAFKNIMKFTGCSIAEAVQMTSVNQAKEFNLTDRGILEKHKRADFLVLNDDFTLYKTVNRGK